MSKPITKIINGDDAANVLSGTNAGETIFGQGGNDSISSWGGNDTVFGGLDNDVVNGGRGNDWLFGDEGKDTLVGERGNDQLFGGDGDDRLLGGPGNDTLDGGAGADIFLVSKGAGIDRIQNFSAEDKIDLGAFRFGSAQEAIGAFEQIGPDAVLELGGGGRLVLENTSIAGLTTNQFDVSPYLVPTDADPTTPEIDSNISFVPLITVGDDADGDTFAGIPDGIGAFDNGDGTFTALVNHEFTATEGGVRDHGFAGAYVSKLVIDKQSLEVLESSDLIQHAFEYDPSTGGYVALNDAFNRFCSADLALETAFYNPASGLGYNGGRLFLNGEESGVEGRAFAHIASGDEAGNSYELAWFGNLAFENVIANSHTGDKTVVAATDDGQNGQVYFYVGDKKAAGNAIERAGLTGGSLYGLRVAELDTAADSNNESDGTNLGGDFQSAFTLVSLGDVSAKDGATLDASSETLGVTSFLRPEDGAWDTINSNRFYFVTTNAFGHPTRLWAADFNDASDPSKGGTIKILLDGTEGQQMFDNITVNKDGKLILSEDVGNNDHVGKVWQYDPATDTLTQLAQHDPARFAPGGDFFLTRDEESSGVIDVTGILGSDTRNAYLIDVQAHFNLGGELVQGGQLLVLYQNNVVNDFTGTTRSELLLENTAGAVAVARVGSDGQAAYSQIAALGSEWSFKANGDFLGDGSTDFLIRNDNGAVVVGDVLNGQAQYTQVATLGSEWKFVGAGDYLDAGFDQFLLENASGAILVADAHSGEAAYTQVAALGTEWKFVGSGDFLEEGHDQFLIKNDSGVIVVGDVQNGQAAYTEVASLGSEWTFVGTGDFLGKGYDQFLIENSSGAVVVGDVWSGGAQYTQVGSLGSEWSFIGAGDYLGTGTAGFAIENQSGAVFLGTIANGSASYSQIGAIGSEWASHS